MEKAIKFLSVCVLLSMIILSASMIVSSYIKSLDNSKITDRYEFNSNPPLSIFDKLTGDVYLYEPTGENNRYGFNKYSPLEK
jgi:hypothetical protein